MLAHAVELYVFDNNHLRTGMLKNRLTRYCQWLAAIARSDIKYCLRRPHRCFSETFAFRILAHKLKNRRIMLCNLINKIVQ